jgi:hypothetical protein
MSIYVCVYVCVCVYVHTHTNTHIYTHTQTHTHTQSGNAALQDIDEGCGKGAATGPRGRSRACEFRQAVHGRAFAIRQGPQARFELAVFLLLLLLPPPPLPPRLRHGGSLGRETHEPHQR